MSIIHETNILVNQTKYLCDRLYLVQLVAWNSVILSMIQRCRFNPQQGQHVASLSEILSALLQSIHINCAKYQRKDWKIRQNMQQLYK